MAGTIAEAKPKAASPGGLRGPSDAYGLLAWGFVALGAALCGIHYFGARALWLDEAMIALNLQHLSYAELAGRLDYGQIAPIGWIYLHKALWELTHNLELGLRLTSFASALATLVLFRGLAFRELDRFGGLAATALICLSSPLVGYSANVKPYAVDILLVVMILDATTRLMRGDDRRWGAELYLALVGALTVLFSFPAVFALGACTGVVIVRRLLERRLWPAARLVAMSLLWLAGFAWLYLTVYAPEVKGSDLTSGGSDAFFSRTAYAPFPPKSPHDLLWYADWARDYFTAMFGDRSIYAYGLLVAAGFWRLATRQAWLLLMIAGVFALAVVASSIKAYPLYHRLALFLLPAFILTAGAGADFLVQRTKGAALPAAAIVLLASLASLSGLAHNLRLKPPYANQQIQPLLATVKAQLKPGDVIYVSNVGIPGFLLYGPRYGLFERPWIAASLGERTWPCIERRLPAMSPGSSVWMLFVLNDYPTKWAEAKPALPGPGAALTQVGSNVDATLYRLAVSSTAPPPPGPPPEACVDRGSGQKFDAPARLLTRIAAGG